MHQIFLIYENPAQLWTDIKIYTTMYSKWVHKKKNSIISIHIYKNKNHSLTIVSGGWEYISVF